MKILLLLLALLPGCLWAQAEEEASVVDSAALVRAIDSLQYVYDHDSIKGTVSMVYLDEAHSYINVPEGYCYLSKEKTRHLIEDYWSNPEDDDVIGSIIKDSAKTFAGVDVVFLIYYDECGYVKDEDADSYNYDDILAEKRKDAEEQNEERKALGYETIEVVGWADAPFYDSEKKALHWALHARFGEGDEVNETLNYDIRMLGRKGMLILKAVAQMDDMPQVKEMRNVIVENTHFIEGYTYNDFDPVTDHIAEWGIGTLVAGKLLAKAGILAKCTAFLLKFWKFIVVAVGVVITYFFKKKEK